MHKQSNKNTDNKKLVEQAAEQWIQLLFLQIQSSKKPTSKNLEFSISAIKNKYPYEIANK